MFVAINYISCQPDYTDRFETLFQSRAGAIDKMPGFISMQVLKPQTSPDDPYLVVSQWESEENFKAWTKSEAFIEGHKRGFEDVAQARKEGRTPPMTSDFKTYNVIAN